MPFSWLLFKKANITELNILLQHDPDSLVWYSYWCLDLYFKRQRNVVVFELEKKIDIDAFPLRTLDFQHWTVCCGRLTHVHSEKPYNSLEPPRFPANQSGFISDEDVLLTYEKSGTLHVPLYCLRKVLGDPEQPVDVIPQFCQVSSLYHRQQNSCSVSAKKKRSMAGWPTIMMAENAWEMPPDSFFLTNSKGPVDPVLWRYGCDMDIIRNKG